MGAGAERELVDFLLARIAEDERTARAAVRTTGAGDVAGWYWSSAGECVCLDETAVVVVGGWESSRPAGAHIVRWDPERVLAECAARRRVVERCSDRASGTADPDTLRLLALPYADHPDHRAEWHPGGQESDLADDEVTDARTGT